MQWLRRRSAQQSILNRRSRFASPSLGDSELESRGGNASRHVGVANSCLHDAARRRPGPQADRQPRADCRSACCRTARSSRSSTPKAPAGSSSTRRSLRRSPAAWGAFFFASAARIPRSWRASAPRRRAKSAPRTTASSGREKQRGVFCRVTLWLAPDSNVWLWRLAVENRRETELPCDALFIQDLGLADPGFLMSNEAYACQYLDHFVARHPRAGSVVMSRQNLAQGGAHPWAAHGCLDGAAGFATDLRELMGPACRDADGIGLAFGVALSSQRLQYETGCAALQSKAATLAPGSATSWTFFGAYQPDHPGAVVRRRPGARRRGRTDLRRDGGSATSSSPRRRALSSIRRRSPSPIGLDDRAIGARYRRRAHVERPRRRDAVVLHPGGRPQPPRRAARQGAQRSRAATARCCAAARRCCRLRTPCAPPPGCTASSPPSSLSATRRFTSSFRSRAIPTTSCAATASESSSIWVDGWRLLAVPSAFEMGLCDCRWIYRFGERTIIVSARVSSREPALQWRVAAEGGKCRFLVFGHLALGEHEYASRGRGRDRRSAESNSSFGPIPTACGESATRTPPTAW